MIAADVMTGHALSVPLDAAGADAVRMMRERRRFVRESGGGRRATKFSRAHGRHARTGMTRDAACVAAGAPLAGLKAPDETR